MKHEWSTPVTTVEKLYIALTAKVEDLVMAGELFVQITGHFLLDR